MFVSPHLRAGGRQSCCSCRVTLPPTRGILGSTKQSGSDKHCISLNVLPITPNLVTLIAKAIRALQSERKQKIYAITSAQIELKSCNKLQRRPLSPVTLRGTFNSQLRGRNSIKNKNLFHFHCWPNETSVTCSFPVCVCLVSQLYEWLFDLC